MVTKSTGIIIGILVLVLIALAIILGLYFTNTPPFSTDVPPPDGAVVY